MLLLLLLLRVFGNDAAGLTAYNRPPASALYAVVGLPDAHYLEASRLRGEKSVCRSLFFSSLVPGGARCSWVSEGAFELLPVGETSGVPPGCERVCAVHTI